MAKKEGVSFQDMLNKYSVETTTEMWPTGSLVLDDLMGGGVAKGSMTALWSIQGSGKTSLCLQMVKRFCKQGKHCLYVDVEKALNENQQEAFGVREFVKNGMLYVVTVDNYSQLDELFTAVCNDSDVEFVIVDSESALLPNLPKDTDISSERPGQKARQSQLLMTKVKSIFYQKGIASIWLFHARANITMGPSNPYSPTEKMAGGWGSRHIPDQLIKIQPGQKIKDASDTIVGQVCHIQAEKSKFAVPFRNFDIKLYFGKGIKHAIEVIDLAIDKGLVTQEGRSWVFPDGTKVSGRDNVYTVSKETVLSLESLVKERMQ